MLYVIIIQKRKLNIDFNKYFNIIHIKVSDLPESNRLPFDNYSYLKLLQSNALPNELKSDETSKSEYTQDILIYVVFLSCFYKKYIITFYTFGYFTRFCEAIKLQFYMVKII